MVQYIHGHITPRRDGPVGDAEPHEFAVGAPPKSESHRPNGREEELRLEEMQDLFGMATLDQNGAVRAGSTDLDVSGTPSRLESRIRHVQLRHSH